MYEHLHFKLRKYVKRDSLALPLTLKNKFYTERVTELLLMKLLPVPKTQTNKIIFVMSRKIFFAPPLNDNSPLLQLKSFFCSFMFSCSENTASTPQETQAVR